MLALLALLQQRRAHGRNQRQRHDQRGQQRIGDGQRDILEQLARHALQKHDGQKHADGGQRGREQRAGHLIGALDAGLQDRQLLLIAQSVDVLDDHDGIVHQHTDGQGKSAQRNDVQRDVGEIHAHQSRHHAQRYGAGDDDGGPQIGQEDGQHDHGQDRAHAQALQHGIDNQVDVHALIHQRGEAQVPVPGGQPGECIGDLLTDLGGGGGGLLGEGQRHGGIAVDDGEHLVAVVGSLHAGHVHQAHLVHGVQTHLEQHQILQLVDAPELVAHTHQILIVALVHVARGHGDVLRAQNLGDHLHGDDAVDVGVLQRLVALLLEFLPALGQLLFGVGQLALRVAESGQRRLPRRLQLRQRVGNFRVLVHALHHAAGQDAVVQLRQHGVHLRHARVDLRQRNHQLLALRLQRAGIGLHLLPGQIGLIRFGIPDGGNLLVHCGDLRVQRICRTAVHGRLHGAQLRLGGGQQRLIGGQLALGLGEQLLRRFQLRPVLLGHGPAVQLIQLRLIRLDGGGVRTNGGTKTHVLLRQRIDARLGIRSSLTGLVQRLLRLFHGIRRISGQRLVQCPLVFVHGCLQAFQLIRQCIPIRRLFGDGRLVDGLHCLQRLDLRVQARNGVLRVLQLPFRLGQRRLRLLHRLSPGLRRSQRLLPAHHVGILLIQLHLQAVDHAAIGGDGLLRGGVFSVQALDFGLQLLDARLLCVGQALG